MRLDIWFSTVDTVLCTVRGMMRLDMEHPWANSPLHGVGDDFHPCQACT